MVVSAVAAASVALEEVGRRCPAGCRVDCRRPPREAGDAAEGEGDWVCFRLREVGDKEGVEEASRLCPDGTEDPGLLTSTAT